MECLTLPGLGDRFVREVARTVRDNGLVKPGDTVLLAVSGGADSTALAVVFRVIAQELSLTLHIAHVNHRLRAETSDADARWVGDLAGALDIPFHLVVVDVGSLHRAHGGSLEEVARDARYRALHACAAECGAELIATAHHHDDQAETVLLHLLRGAGLDGLSGIERRSSSGVIRPFLDVTAKEIRQALSRWQIGWREDATNASPEIARNRVRHTLLPYLEKEWNPRVREALVRLADLAHVDDLALEAWVKAVYPQVVHRRSSELIIFDMQALQSYPSGVRRRLIRRAAHSLRNVTRQLTYAETSALEALVGTRKKVEFRGLLRAWATGYHLVFEADDAWQGPTPLSPDGVTHIENWGRLRVHSSAAVPDGRGLFLRRWRPGDRVVVRGRTRLVADFLKELRPQDDPRTAVLVVDGEVVRWVSSLGDRLSADEGGFSGVSFAWEPSVE